MPVCQSARFQLVRRPGVALRLPRVSAQSAVSSCNYLTASVGRIRAQQLAK